MSAEEFTELERAILARLRELRADAGPSLSSPDVKVTGVEARTWDEE